MAESKILILAKFPVAICHNPENAAGDVYLSGIENRRAEPESLAAGLGLEYAHR